jgi:hypothetical protein
MADFAAASASALRETIITLQPSPARISAAARPIPFEPPVIKAVLPAIFKSMLRTPPDAATVNVVPSGGNKLR